MKKNAGFTLAEVIVVVAIIGVLVSLVLINFNDARASARDTKRKADLDILRVSLDLYYREYQFYTVDGGENMCKDYSIGGRANPGCGGVTVTGDWHPNSDLRELVNKGFISVLPTDPLNDATYYYAFEPVDNGQLGHTRRGQAYILCAELETEPDPYCVGAGENWRSINIQ